MTDSDEHNLTGSQKAALLMVAMGEQRAGRLQLGLDKDEVEELHAARKSLGQVPSEMVEKIIDEYDHKRAALPMNQPQNRDLREQQDQARRQPARKAAVQPPKSPAAPPKPAADVPEDGTAPAVTHLTNIEV